MKSKLPKGAKLIPSRTAEIGNWVKQTFDARVERHGVVWLRVKDGMSGRGNREDWVANIPDVCISIHDYQWNGDSFGANHGSFDNACHQELKSGLAVARRRLSDAEDECARLRVAVSKLEKAVRRRR